MGGFTLTAALGIACALFATLFSVCLVRLIQHGREAVRLHDQIMRFLSDECTTPSFSVRDDRFALFENAVKELEARLLQADDNRVDERRRTERLIVDISHQLKTPIAGLKLYCEMDSGVHMDMQLKLLDRMEHLIGSLLRLERLRADGYTFHFELADLADVAREACARVTPLFPGRAVEVCGSATMSCDRAWMDEAFGNLIKNACEHTREGSRIGISFEQTEGSAMCVFQDDGGGVPPAEVSQLFRRFFRSSASTSPDGAGVGLAIVRAIVEKHHGAAFAENAGGGLRITLCLPVLHGRLKKT